MSLRHFLFPLLVMVTACAENAPPAAEVARSACRELRFEGSGFVVCEPASGKALTLHAAASGQSAKREFRDLGIDDGAVAFAMNAGMFDDSGHPIGLAIVNGKQVHKISLRRGGGNFGMKPNGVFLVRDDGSAEIVASDKYNASPDIRLATQSGPMLVIDGKLHPEIQPNGSSLFIRNAVGIASGGKPLFVISSDPVSFGRLARFLRDRLKVKNALYFDGSVSSLWDPANGRMDLVTPLGPIIVAAKR